MTRPGKGPPTTPAPDADATARRGGVQGVAGLVARLLEPGARRRGFVRATLLTDWPLVVGPELAARCVPVRVRFPRGRSHGGTLVLRAGGGTVLELRHLQPQLIERINRHLGMPAIARLVFETGPLPPSPLPPARLPEPPPDPAMLARIEAMVAQVADPELAALLRRMGEDLARRRTGVGAD